MRHSSVKMNTPCEPINVTPLNPLISKCQIKVCYVSDDPNRNKSVITKEVATKMANSLPGSPIVGYFNRETEDFEQHSKQLEIIDGKIAITEKTKPYGFVDLNAKCWFQKFVDDGDQEHEYLMTEGYLWTGQYPECQKVIEDGSNQSMELCQDEEFLNAHWTKDANGKPLFFIINEALISKLCILGDDYDPCFEGAQISKVEFSFEDGFMDTFSNMIFQLKEILDKGGFQEMPNQEELEFEKKKKEQEEQDKKEQEKTPGTEDNSEGGKTEDEDEKKKKKTQYAEEKCPECGKPIAECTCKKSNYCLEDIVEYTELKAKYEDLENKYNDAMANYNSLSDQIQKLAEFKSNAERKEKEAMVASFYMLSDEDKADVLAKIDEYTLDEVESKLSVICVRNKVNFNLDNEEEKPVEDKDDNPLSYNLNNDDVETVPAWVAAVRSVKKEKGLQ